VWITLWDTGGETGDNRWVTAEQLGDFHRGRCSVHFRRTPPVQKKWAANWENNGFPSLHRPYDYDVLIYE